jgi:hypothetical protein
MKTLRFLAFVCALVVSAQASATPPGPGWTPIGQTISSAPAPGDPCTTVHTISTTWSYGGSSGSVTVTTHESLHLFNEALCGPIQP